MVSKRVKVWELQEFAKAMRARTGGLSSDWFDAGMGTAAEIGYCAATGGSFEGHQRSRGALRRPAGAHQRLHGVPGRPVGCPW